jgi:DNA-binding transcriptional MerR regulator
MSVPARAYLSIGEVLSKLRSEFPDVTISKIRFLESEGLIEPERTPSGYRKFKTIDLERLRYVLSAQRDQYLPLRVIKENLDALDRGLRPSNVPGSPAAPRLATIDGEFAPSNFIHDSQLRLSRDELIQSSGLLEAQLAQIESFGLIEMKGRYYDADALAVARAVAEMSSFGIEARHLRSFKTSADREVGLVEQVITPLLRQKGSEAAARAEEVQRELASLSIRLHAALVASGLHRAK